jgi:CheY-like chemotaxis protein
MRRSFMSHVPVGRPMEILLVEDDLEDAGFTIDALKRGQVRCRVSLVRDGEEALQFIYRQDRFARAPRPDLILLDLQLPKLSGREVLAEIKVSSQYSLIPVVVLTASTAHEQILREEGLHVEDYLVKPVDFEQFVASVRRLRQWMLADVILPA